MCKPLDKLFTNEKTILIFILLFFLLDKINARTDTSIYVQVSLKINGETKKLNDNNKTFVAWCSFNEAPMPHVLKDSLIDNKLKNEIWFYLPSVSSDLNLKFRCKHKESFARNGKSKEETVKFYSRRAELNPRTIKKVNFMFIYIFTENESYQKFLLSESSNLKCKDPQYLLNGDQVSNQRPVVIIGFFENSDATKLIYCESI